ncbi:transcription termination factor NusA [Candidatus Phytoplasma oryzae]|uniref:Transcription termination/antitermination protein NusA n=1 Tax=Candidatus Phytoplasma oryzae TaxID=203274 RepID=A0A139JR42_9MOLU|nr:transcription termination factor NusA [Candidatus Phytoplasma oryzae]KXT29422.1 transcription termination factor NusA [Candidatus Phytoplasma oryzae]RAM58003.1 transcription termination factor NusA [Candidatus Phytoplasma oryzae]
MKAKDFLDNIEKLSKEYEISNEQTLEALEKGLISGCKKNYQVKSCSVSFDKENNEIFLYKQYLVVDSENIKNSYDNDIAVNFKKNSFLKLEEAQKIKKDIKVGDILNILVDPKEFNFYASKEFKNKFNEELIKKRRENIYNFFKKYEKKIIIAEVISVSEFFFTLRLEKNISTILLKKESLSNDNFYINEKIQVYVVEVRNTNKMPKIFVSRIKKGFVKEIFRDLIPEIQEGIIKIMGISRVPSVRTKIGLFSKDKKIDPIGSCIGEKSNRIKSIINILNGEKINLFLWSDNIEELIFNSLQPAKVHEIVSIDQYNKTSLVLVTPEQASLAIGKLGINVYLASKAIGWDIKIKIIEDKKY